MKHNVANVCLILLLICLLTACDGTGPMSAPSGTGTPVPPPTTGVAAPPRTVVPPTMMVSPPTPSARSAEIDALFRPFEQPPEGAASGSPGGAVMVIQNGQVLHRAGYGLANLELGTPITPEHLFHLGSIGKQFTALGIMMLAEQGRIAYDDPIGQYLPELAHLGDGITIRHLLHHTSGIPDCYDDKTMYHKLLSRSENPTNKDLLAVLAATDRLRFTPGERFSYSNTGYEVLGSLIERVSGQPYPAFMQERIFGPLNMTHSFSMPNPDRLSDPNLAFSYVRRGQRIEVYESDPLDNLVGSGSFYSTVDDLYLYDQALYTDRLVSQSTLAEAFQPAALNDGRKSPYGFAWGLDTYKGIPYTAHGGNWLGFWAYYVRFPEQRTSVIVLLNLDYADPNADALAFAVADLYLK